MNILITGGASGLGQAITSHLAAGHQHYIYFTYNNSAENAAVLEKQFTNAKALRCDFLNTAEVSQLAESLADLQIDVLINNAMTGFTQNHFHKLEPAYFADSFNKNVLPVITITQAAIKHFRKKKSGKIITILSAAIVGNPPVGWSEYVAVKSYLLALNKSWATENAAFNITANCISPSFMQTALTSGTDERMVEDMRAKHPLKKLLTVEETASAVGSLVEAGHHINGINVVLNAAQNVI
ncbi:MAG: SDR family NAD(P)-dependent oxidoreductase [Chitinophagaceae bacterium]|nr:MAG: SDR family NAD(P)-dependent oxidoreductase [Chitinophagaceae bacterium]